MKFDEGPGSCGIRLKKEHLRSVLAVPDLRTRCSWGFGRIWGLTLEPCDFYNMWGGFLGARDSIWVYGGSFLGVLLTVPSMLVIYDKS